ncbi:MAG TPA: hypothetical protein VJN95_16710 [Gemmatimonadales bacterium]|nr:hypothetical protein [Gemmatimonadales bacterium]
MTFTGKHLRRFALPLSTLAVLSGAAACGGNDNGGGNNGGGGLQASTTYSGYVAGTDGTAGSLAITFASAVAAPPSLRTDAAGPSLAGGAPVAATGTVVVGGTSYPISGTLDAGTLTMTADPAPFGLSGTLADGQITGDITGSESGSFAAVSNTDGTPAQTYCGYFQGVEDDGGAADLGWFNAVVVGGIVRATSVGDGGTVYDVHGTISGSNFTIAESVAEGSLNVSGHFNADSTWGTYNTKAGSVQVTHGDFFGYPNCGEAVAAPRH